MQKCPTQPSPHCAYNVHLGSRRARMLLPFRQGELEITDMDNYYIEQGWMGYWVQAGYWSDAGTFESLLRAGMMVNKHREKKEVTTDEHRFIIITLLIYFGLSPTPSKMPQT